ncbi:hypothetical protein ACFO5X_01295 [Seohaeicola nanhaiensis]|uniref:DUF5302 domain-containing protein n=1 Tax=Seohaeicola nanhaiensis TaxID=1387282 RepID=A0ABV9KB55_9RHOB
MADKAAPGKGAKQKPDRDERLKAALKANLARRKAQARARGQGGTTAGRKEEQD